MKKHQFPKRVRIIDDGTLDPQDNFSRALVGCELHPDLGICLGWENPTWLVFGVKVEDLKKKIP